MISTQLEVPVVSLGLRVIRVILLVGLLLFQIQRFLQNIGLIFQAQIRLAAL